MHSFWGRLCCRLGWHDLDGCSCRRCSAVRHDFSRRAEEREETPGAWDSDFGGYDAIVRTYWVCSRCGKRKFEREWIV